MTKDFLGGFYKGHFTTRACMKRKIQIQTKELMQLKVRRNTIKWKMVAGGGGGCVFQEICEFSEPPDQLNILLLSRLIKLLLSHSCSLFMCGRHSLLQLFLFLTDRLYYQV